tara:strand:- start:451 stop:945 length:495 start_codon:yes stop_codon:yes gene_type:complete
MENSSYINVDKLISQPSTSNKDVAAFVQTVYENANTMRNEDIALEAKRLAHNRVIKATDKVIIMKAEFTTETHALKLEIEQLKKDVQFKQLFADKFRNDAEFANERYDKIVKMLSMIGVKLDTFKIPADYRTTRFFGKDVPVTPREAVTKLGNEVKDIIKRYAH